MAINYDKYINSTGTHYISNSGGDERGKTTGGSAGDQTGKEWQLKAWYSRPWNYVLRHPDPKVRRLIAELAIEGALNDKIGYDQYQRTTFWKQLEVSGYRPANITVKCEEDCSAGVNSIVKAVGYLLYIDKLRNVNSANSSRNTRSGLKAAGFEVLTDSKYTKKYSYLLPGDILLYENHHVATNITRGKNAVGEVASSVMVGDSIKKELGDRELKKGMTGNDVKELQQLLIKLGYSCGPDGADGDFGENTKKAVKAFQGDHELSATGIADLATITALQAAGIVDVTETPVSGACVTIQNCTACNIRSGPGREFEVLGIAHPGDVFSAAPDGWVPVIRNGKVGWVSELYAKEVK